MTQHYIDPLQHRNLDSQVVGWQQLWTHCCNRLEDELPAQQFNTWIRPLQADISNDTLFLLAPNRFVRDWVAAKFLPRIHEMASQLGLQDKSRIDIRAREAGARPQNGFGLATGPMSTNQQGLDDGLERRTAPGLPDGNDRPQLTGNSGGLAVNTFGTEEHSVIPSPGGTMIQSPTNAPLAAARSGERALYREDSPGQADFESGVPGPAARQEQRKLQQIASQQTSSHQDNLIETYRFDNFVEGKSNQLARAAAGQVVENPGGSYNPLFLYGGVGLGKTHLMHAVGNALKQRKPGARVVYLHSERFVADMVKALQLNAINDFKRFYRSVDALLIDDIQFFANKERSQEEFFHTFNALLEGNKQMILSCDRYPKEINGMEERLKSRFGWGLTVAIEPPELETRVAILMKKAEQANMPMDNDSAFFLAQRVRSNVRELEGALKRVIASAHFHKKPISVDLIKESLKDLLALQDKQVSIENIQRTTAEYYKIRVSDLMSKRRNRSVARPRQVAMALAKELTNHSLPEIGDAFGGRDHTTVLHACRKIKELRETTSEIREDYQNLLRILAT